MKFKEGEVLYFNKPLGWTSFKVVGHARYHICRRMKVKKLKDENTRLKEEIENLKKNSK